MAIRLTESRLRQIVREEAAKLTRRPRSRRLRESSNLNLPQTIQEIIALVNPHASDLRDIRSYIGMGDAEGAMHILLQILGGAEDDPLAAEMASMASMQIQSMDDDQIIDVLSQVEEFQDTPETWAQAAALDRLGSKGGADTLAAAQKMAPIYTSLIPKRSIDYARKTGKADRLFIQIMKHPDYIKLARQHGSAPSNHLAREIIRILVGR